MRDDWIECTVGGLFDTATGNTPSKKEPGNYGQDIPFIKPPNLTDQTITHASEYLSAVGKAKGRVLPKDSIFVTCIGNLGRTGINKYPVAFNQQINGIKPLPMVDAKFTFYQCQSPEFRHNLEKLSSATTVAIVNKGKFNTIPYFLAPLPEQRAIVAKLEQLFSELDNGIANLKAAREKLDVYRQAVLKKAFEGELTREWRLSARKRAQAGMSARERAQAGMSLDDRRRSETKELDSLPNPEKGIFFVYIIQCDNDSFYVGHTDSLQRRWQQHCSGTGADWTKAHKPKYLMHWEVFETREDAAKRERDLKTGFGRTWRKREIKATRMNPIVHNPDLPTALPVHDTGMQTGDLLLKQIKAERQRHYDQQLADWQTAVNTWEQAGQSVPGRQTDRPGKKPRKPKSLKAVEDFSKAELSKLPNLPAHWKWIRILQAGEVQLGRQRSPKHHTGNQMRPYLRVANVFENRIDASDVMEMNFTDAEYEIYKLEYGDILLNEGQSTELVGRPAIYRNEVLGACFTNTLVRFKTSGSISNKFSFYLFLTYLKNGRFQKIASITTNIAHLGAGRFAELEFPLPPHKEQTQIVQEIESRLSVCDKLAETIDTSLQQSESLRQSILKKAFEGRLLTEPELTACRNEPGWEPAEKLLERILKEKNNDKT